MEKKIIFSVLLGALIISVGMLSVRMIVNYYDETGSFYALMAVPLVVYVYGVIGAIILHPVLHPLFKKVISWIQKEKNKDGDDIQQ